MLKVNKLKLTVLILFTSMAFSLGFTHSYLLNLDPAAASTVDEAPNEVSLEMSEAVEIGFSTFKVYKLETSADMSKKDLVKAAEALMDDVLLLQNDQDSPERLDLEILTEEASSKLIRLGLKDDLEPGTFIVMWRVLSIDSHITQDFSFFTYEAKQTP